ncbi:DNA-directed RNA polymerase I subunit rpa43 [Phanerochaete sordida]|uniref:DNA-directed RNA polymerase I subunit rpa43 n=1 Tax=Phanerochaete sordida TaxID=48140 RepID=A0A9P3GHJ6_9APHY|nr:DNA-directed RNA polymerase I subunit rpa43 [Phanerochaete sordida]
MSNVAEHKAKKRKHAAPAVAEEPSSKRSKTEKAKDKSKSKDKSRDRAKGKGRAAPASQFRVVEASLLLSIAPVFANNLRAGAEEMLDSMLMRYVPALQGVVLAHHDLRFLDSKATIKADCPFANCTVNFQATVWSPYVGQKLVGKVNLCSPDHVSLLVHRTFNVSIPRHHIPTDNWEFEYGPAENDPEFGAEDAAEGAEDAEKPEETTESSGRWVHKLTGDKLGGKDGRLEFTVIGLTIANQMLSLIGSIQADPFSPEHAPDHSVQTTAPKKPKQRTAPEPKPPVEVLEILDEDADSDEDTFQALGRLGDEAIAREAARKAEEQAKSEKKRKRKEAKESVQDAEDEGQTEKKKKKKKTS